MEVLLFLVCGVGTEQVATTISAHKVTKISSNVSPLYKLKSNNPKLRCG